MRLIFGITFIFFVAGCNSMRQLGFSNTKQNNSTSSVTTQDQQQKNTETKFLDNISSSNQPVSNIQTNTSNNSLQSPKKKSAGPSENAINSTSTLSNTLSKETDPNTANTINTSSNNSNVAALQMKYAAMLNTDITQIQNLKLFEFIDDWYGTRYCMGGTTKECIDCSAFVQSLFAAVYGISLPRISKDQYKATRRISTTQLKEGDLLFFHTTGRRRGVTHVGIYLANNKFVHSSVSGGVKISDMYEPYYLKHLINAGRIKGGLNVSQTTVNNQQTTTNSQ